MFDSLDLIHEILGNLLLLPCLKFFFYKIGIVIVPNAQTVVFRACRMVSGACIQKI